MKVFTKKHLFDALKEAGLPYSYKSLLKFERLGIIPTNNASGEVSGVNNWRLYTEKEIKEIVKKIRAYKDK